MTQILNRLSLWHKIVGLISVLLLAMLLVAGYSHIKTLQSHDEIQDLNGLLLPILKRLARVEVHALREDIHYERAMALRVGGGKAEDLKTEIDRFKALGEQVIKEVGNVRSLAAQALERVREVEDAVELARIEPLLQGIEKAHKRFREQSIAVLDHTGPTDTELYRTKLAQLERDKDELFESLALMVLQLEEFVAAQALEVVRHDRERTQLSWQLLAVALGAFLVGVGLGTVVTRRMLEPIANLRESAAAVAKGDLDIEVEPRTRDEIGDLALAFNQMVVGLRERESIKETFSSYVDPRIVGHLLSPGNEDHEGDRRGDDRVLLGHRGLHRHLGAAHPEEPGEADQPLSGRHVRAHSGAGGRHRQVHRRRHRGLLGPALRARPGPGGARLPRGAGLPGAPGAVPGAGAGRSRACARARRRSTSASASPPARW